jgi:hypothetical protein
MELASLPVVVIRTPIVPGPVSSRDLRIMQTDGKPFPLFVTKAVVNIDYEHGDPVTVDLTAMGGIAVELTANINTIEIDGRKYRLVPAGEQ